MILMKARDVVGKTQKCNQKPNTEKDTLSTS